MCALIKLFIHSLNIQQLGWAVLTTSFLILTVHLEDQYHGMPKMLNRNTWGIKKVRGQEEPATKSSDIT